MPSQRKKRQRRIRRLRQGRVLEDPCVVTGKRNSGVCRVSAPNRERLRAAQRKAQAEVSEVTSDSEAHASPDAKVTETTEVGTATKVHAPEIKAPEISIPEENKRPEISAPEKTKEAADEFRAPEYVRSPEEVRAPEEVCFAEVCSTEKVGALEEDIEDIKDDNKVAELPKVSEHLRDIATLENTSAETPDMMTAPKMELELMPVPKKAAAQKMSTLEATAGPVPCSEVSVPEIEALGTKNPNVSSLEALDVTPSKPQEVTSSLEPLVSPHSPPELVPALKVTESPKFATGEGKMEATEMVPLKVTADPDITVLEIVKGPEDVNVGLISNQNVEPLVRTKVLDMMEPQMSCSEIKPPTVSACDDLDVTEPDVILAPEVAAQEMKDEVLCEGSVKVPLE
ncbi:periaxin-like [Clarias gariepinus]|uniref:periaxin-like n=1 Tax=Clarias gariepinus TaxID=13013 RepID=UPI00234D66DF|nr:periaxin-like [Clarias gariepinus]